ncbi:Ig-like domain-containing domain [Pontibacter sp. MBLB2868]|uniref:Ig-like domain-containing domain n=1 Tax=Pontibacter sp. MBLB2868 TaxID=3451555 RepID=UPI003F7504F5
MKLGQITLILSTLFGVAACASISAPEGGPKDETPPKLVSSNPQDQALNVKSKTITLVFDEEVQQNNLQKELIITPNTQNKYKVKTDKNQISLEFDKPLLDNTTYSLSFREGITDITEKNKAKDLRISFSTGSYIDSSKVSGTVVNLKTQKPEQKAIVALYPTNDTLSIRKNRPYYQTETDASGNFKMTNIKAGEYRIYALAEKNNNYFYDNEEEKIGYLAGPIKITPTTEPVKLELTKFDTKKPILLRRDQYTDRFVANYNEGIRSIKVKQQAAPKDSLSYKIGVDGKAVELFKTEKFKGGKTIISAVDSSGNIASDTLELKFEGKRAQSIKGAKLKVVNTAKGTTAYTVGAPVTVELETPVKVIGKEPISIKADSTVIAKIKYPEEISVDPTGTELTFKMPKISGNRKQLTVTLDSTLIKPIEGKSLSFTPLPLTLEESGGTGNINGKITTKYTSFIIQLLTPEYKLVKEVKDKKNFQFKNISPGSYLIRVLVDENNNKKWDQGTPDLEKIPEKVYIYPKPIDVRANWDIEDIVLEF